MRSRNATVTMSNMMDSWRSMFASAVSLLVAAADCLPEKGDHFVVES